MRFLFYSHDGFGMGHTCRNLGIAEALTRLAPRASVLMATGSDDITRLGVPERVEVLKLPGLRKLANERYGARYLGIPETDIRSLRARLLASAVESFRPDVLLADKHPFGASGELRDALERLRDLGGRAILGLRDILDDPAAVRAEWLPHSLPERIVDFYDRVLVYGQREIFDVAAEYGFSEVLAARTFYCGYVANPGCPGAVGMGAKPAPLQRSTARPLVLATVGGGEDGFIDTGELYRARLCCVAEIG